jgi:uncharacterized protein YbjT (DUF2867 family)
VTVLGGNENWRNAIVQALGHVALAGNKLLDAGGVTVVGGNVNWRSAIVQALGHVAPVVVVRLFVIWGGPYNVPIVTLYFVLFSSVNMHRKHEYHE